MPDTKSITTELILNLGCGMRAKPRIREARQPHQQIVNSDLRALPHVDVVHDLNVRPWPWHDGTFHGVVAFDVIEHLPDTLGFMDECHRVLRPKGWLYVHTNNAAFPESAWRDPTHLRAFSYETMDFFDPETHWGTQYGRWYTERHWKVEQRIRDGTELGFWLRKRGD